MRLPNSDAHFSARTRYGRYLARRLRQARFTTLAADVEHATALVKQAGRALEDAEEPIQDFIADRDGFDGDLDFAAQSERNELAGRSLDAVRTEPYKSLFDKGIGYDVAAPSTRKMPAIASLSRATRRTCPPTTSSASPRSRP